MKKIKTIIKLQAPGGAATPAPPLGTTFGQHGLNIQDFCTRFNDATQDRRGETVPVVMTVYEDKSFDLKYKTAPAADMLRKASGAKKGSGDPLKKKVGKVSQKQLEEIAEVKLEDLNAHSVAQAAKIIAGTARSMGLEVTK